MSTTGPVETEVKIRCAGDASAMYLLIESAGYVRESQRTLEADQLFDLPGESLRAADKILRLRTESNASGTQWTLTYKGPAARERYKVREEIEVEAAQGGNFALILDRLGYIPGFRYEKYRTKFRRNSEPGIVTVDETPMGVFLELEGPTGWIDPTAAGLGFVLSDYVTLSYAALWRQYSAGNQDMPEDMLFQTVSGAP